MKQIDRGMVETGEHTGRKVADQARQFESGHSRGRSGFDVMHSKPRLDLDNVSQVWTVGSGENLARHARTSQSG